MGTLAGCGGNKAAETGNKTEGKTGETQETSGAEEVEMADASEVDGTEISFWHSMGGVNGQAIDTLVKKFNDENEYGITVKAQYQGEYEKLPDWKYGGRFSTGIRNRNQIYD